MDQSQNIGVKIGKKRRIKYGVPRIKNNNRKEKSEMYKKIEIVRYIFLFSAIFNLMLTLTSCSSQNYNNKTIDYKLSIRGFYPEENKLLFIAHVPKNMIFYNREYLLGVCDINKCHIKYILSPPPLDFSWQPGRDTFVVTNGDRISLFESSKNDPNETYVGINIQCPINFNYTFCAWSPDGKWLAVNSYDLMSEKGYKLNMFNQDTGKFIITDIGIGSLPPIWKDNNNLYVSSENNILELNMISETPQIVKTFNLRTKPTWFYGIVDGKPLFLQQNKLYLGETELINLDYSSKGSVIWTGTYIFVAQNRNNFLVFNNKGKEECHINPGQIIRFGSIGEDSSIVYCTVGSKLLRISMKGKSIHLDEICDLSQS